MLKSLQVHNFALIEDATVDFVPGFNIFTGETGAGKSILIDAFSMVLGSRASADFIRSGADSFWVQAVFDPEGSPQVKRILAEQDIEEDEFLFLKRKLSLNGKSQNCVNGVQVPLAVVKALSELLVDIHGQHENQALLKPQTPLRLIDIYGGSGVKQALAEYQAVYVKYVAAAAKVKELQNSDADRERLLDRLDWEIKEILEAQLEPDEEAKLQKEAKLLQNGSRILDAVSGAHEALDAEDGILEVLARARDGLGGVTRYDPQLQKYYEVLDSAWINLDDLRQELSGYLSGSSFDEERVEAVQKRLDLYYRLHKKYGADYEAVQNYLHQAQERYSELQDLESRIAQAEKNLSAAKKETLARGALLTRLRQEKAQLLAQDVVQHIQDLAMPYGRFEFSFKEVGCGASGRDEINFLFSANKGEPLQTLGRVASGGELSRVALALKTVLSHVTGVPTMVFDEIDTGVGGITAQKMAEKLAIIAAGSQVLCITHLPQIAAYADRHIHIVKSSEGERTATRLEVLQGREQVEEIRRMTAGDNTSAAATASAREQLSAAARFKNNLQKLL